MCTGGTGAQCQLRSKASTPKVLSPKAVSPEDRLPVREVPEALQEGQLLVRQEPEAWQEDQQRLRALRRAARNKRKANASTSWRPASQRRQWLNNRRPRMVLGARLGIHSSSSRYSLEDELSGGQGGLQGGLRWHLHNQFGLQLMAEALIGSWYERGLDSVQGSVRSLRIKLAPYFRPARNFMVGPTLSIGRNYYALYENRWDPKPISSRKWLTGYGVQFGWLLGAEQQIQFTSGFMVIEESDEGIAALPIGRASLEMYSTLSFAF